MKLKRRSTAVAAALFFSSLHAFAQDEAPSADEPEVATPAENGAEPEAPDETKAEPRTASASASASTPASVSAPMAAPAPAPVDYVGFAPPPEPLEIEKGNSKIRFGLLLQPQYEQVGAPDAEKTSKNLYLRRAGFLVGATVLKYFDFFFDVDFPNLFKADPSNQSGGTGKNAPGLNVQDAFVTFVPTRAFEGYEDYLKVDAGFMLPPFSYNGIQGAGTLYGVDYFVNTFRRNVYSSTDVFKSSGQSPGGRDAGVQLRGLVLGAHVEYRVGMFQGVRLGPVPASTSTKAVAGALNFFRVAARLQANVLDGDPNYFHQGTYLGEKKILSVGAFYDFQDEYYFRGVDVLVDVPAGPVIITAQADLVQWTGGHFVKELKPGSSIMAEAGVLVRPVMLGPFGRVEFLDNEHVTATEPQEQRYGGGLSFWPFGHNANLKAFFTSVHRRPAPHDFWQANLQWQLYFF